ncbi:nucleotidyltransferase family protein [Hydrogenimonas sp. SS33]|uniref:nucleotidyltransferase domain-containing protein n=1 Tax=Hydrogenimonas leucolamina TaxID=2954236 RepID=UPI00336C22F6
MDRRKEILQLCAFLSLDEKSKEFIINELKNENVDWMKLLAVSNEHLLTPALYAKIEANGLTKLLADEELQGFLEAVYRNNRKRNLGIVEQIGDIDSILGRKEIFPLVLKGGAVLLEELYPDIGMRVMNDLDIMIGEPRFDEARRLLKEEGYIEFGREMGRWHHHSPRIRKEGFPAAVEPHFRIIYDREIEYIPYDETTSVSTSRNGFTHTRVLKPTWLLYHAFLHSAVVDRNHRRWKLALRYLYDFVVIADTCREKIDWEKIEKLSIRYGHERELRDYLYLGKRLFGLKTPLKCNNLRGALHLKKCLWESTLTPHTTLHKFYAAYTDFSDIYGYEKLKEFYGLQSKAQYPAALVRYFLYHGKKHLIEENRKS